MTNIGKYDDYIYIYMCVCVRVCVCVHHYFPVFVISSYVYVQLVIYRVCLVVIIVCSTWSPIISGQAGRGPVGV